MTPEDLRAIGIQSPGHRKLLSSAIGRLGLSDGLPGHLPDTLQEWMEGMGLQVRLGLHTCRGRRSHNKEFC